MKYALKYAYCGEKFYGSQKQPNKRTVQEELEKVLGRVKTASRTDRGVSALGAVCSFQATSKPNINRINQLLPQDIMARSMVKVRDNFNPRHASMKHYKYYWPGQDYNLKRLEEKEYEIPPGTELQDLSISKEEGFLVFDFRGPHFGYKAVRKIIAQKLGLGIAPPWGLILMNTQYPEVKFKDTIKPAFKKRFQKTLRKHQQLTRVIEDLRRV